MDLKIAIASSPKTIEINHANRDAINIEHHLPRHTD